MSYNQLIKYKDIKAVPILEMQNDGEKFNLNIDSLREIFLQVPNTPVTIFSISGALRGGKSFLLNMLLYYHFKQRFADLSGDHPKEIRDIFESTNGSQRQTIGIHITNKPIMLPGKNGEDIALFLMDTEGLFDKGRNAKECSTIFAMSTLLSSLQIYNVSGNLTENDLQLLQNFCNYTMATEREVNDSSDDTCVQFQRLMFLVRNWQNIKDHKHGSEGGGHYLDEFFETDVVENQLVRKQVKSRFSQVRCFLMPNPGDKVAQSHGPEIYFSDVSKGFLEQIRELGKQLFCKESISALKLKDITITGQGFVNLAVQYAEILAGGKMPPAESISEANCWVVILYSIAKIQEDYSVSMKEKIGDVYIKPKYLEELHNQCFKLAEQEFDKLMQQNLIYVESNKERVELYQKQMLEYLSVNFANLQSKNNVKQADLSLEITACSESAAKLYQAQLEQVEHRDAQMYSKATSKVSKNKMASENIDFAEVKIIAVRQCMELHIRISVTQFSDGPYLEDLSEPKLIAERALEEFKMQTKDFDQDLCKACEAIFQTEIESKYKEFKEKNEQKLKTVQAILKSLVSTLENKYDEEMNKGIEAQKENVNFEELHENAFAVAVQAFEDSDVGNGLPCRSVELQTLKDKLGITAERYRKICKYREGELSNIVMNAENIYKKCIAGIKHDTYLEEGVIEQKHDKSKCKAMKVVRDLQQQPGKEALVQKCKESIKDNINVHLELLKKKNELLQVKAGRMFNERRQKLLNEHFIKAFKDVMEIYVEDEKLSKRLEEAKKKVLTKYEDCEAPPKKEFKNVKQELQSDMEKHTDKINTLNRKHKQKIVEQLEKFHQMLLVDYTALIMEITSDRYANAENKNKLHSKFEKMIKKELKRAIPFEDIKKDAIAKCTENMNDTWAISATDITWGKFVLGHTKKGAEGGVRYGGLVLGVAGSAVLGLLGLVGGGVVGMARSKLGFDPDLSVSELPSVIYLNKLFPKKSTPDCISPHSSNPFQSVVPVTAAGQLEFYHGVG